jgi:hypothetical protein
VIEEVLRNIGALPVTASAEWARLRPNLLLMDDVLTLDRPAVFEACAATRAIRAGTFSCAASRVDQR